MIMILRMKYHQCCAFRRILKDPESRLYFLKNTRCKFWGIRSHKVDVERQSCHQVKGQNWIGKILTMMALRTHPTTFWDVTQVALTGYKVGVNHVEEQRALAIVPALFYDPIHVLGEENSDELTDEFDTN